MIIFDRLQINTLSPGSHLCLLSDSCVFLFLYFYHLSYCCWDNYHCGESNNNLDFFRNAGEVRGSKV